MVQLLEGVWQLRGFSLCLDVFRNLVDLPIKNGDFP
jgi:hypothetical protein